MKIYMYSTDLYRQKGYFKIGQTDRDPDARIKEQDTTSNPEILIKCMSWELLGPVKDTDVHDYLERQGYRRTRNDTYREWFYINHDDPIGVVHEAVLAVNTRINGSYYPVMPLDTQWVTQYEQRKLQLSEAYQVKIFNDCFEHCKAVDRTQKLWQKDIEQNGISQRAIDIINSKHTELINQRNFLYWAKFVEPMKSRRIAKVDAMLDDSRRLMEEANAKMSIIKLNEELKNQQEALDKKIMNRKLNLVFGIIAVCFWAWFASYYLK